jgi:hypothetical protein
VTFAFTLLDLETGTIIPEIDPAIGSFVLRLLETGSDYKYDSDVFEDNDREFYKTLQSKNLTYTKLSFSYCTYDNLFLDPRDK